MFDEKVDETYEQELLNERLRLLAKTVRVSASFIDCDGSVRLLTVVKHDAVEHYFTILPSPPGYFTVRFVDGKKASGKFTERGAVTSSDLGRLDDVIMAVVEQMDKVLLTLHGEDYASTILKNVPPHTEEKSVDAEKGSY